jgi:hypothetical protein
MAINPTLDQLERIAAAQELLHALGAASLLLIVAGVFLAVWNLVNRRDP